MGCCGQKRQRRYKASRSINKTSKGVKSQLVKKLSPQSVRSRRVVRKICPKCGYPMSSNVRKYDSKAKKAVVLWSCTKKTCGHKITI